MGKKQQEKDEAPNPNSIVNREIFQRLNFLYQASAYLKGLEAARSDPSSTDTKKQADKVEDQKSRKRRRVDLGDLGSDYVRNMRTIGNKTVVRMDPNVKRTLCKSCDTVLVVGTTASVRIKGSQDVRHKIMYNCLSCGASRVIPAPPITSTFVSHMVPPSVEPSSNPPFAVVSSTTLEDTFEGVGIPSSSLPDSQGLPRRKKPKRPATRPLPLFARQSAGHVVFRGNEVLKE